MSALNTLAKANLEILYRVDIQESKNIIFYLYRFRLIEILLIEID